MSGLNFCLRHELGEKCYQLKKKKKDSHYFLLESQSKITLKLEESSDDYDNSYLSSPYYVQGALPSTF